MRQRAPRTPKYCKHKASGQAVVRLGGRDVYLGKYNSAQSHRAYKRVILEWAVGGQAGQPTERLTLNRVLAAYLRFWRKYNRTPDRTPSRDIYSLKSILALINELYGDTWADHFDATKLLAIQAAMVQRGWTRKSINKQISRVRGIIGWAVGRQLIHQPNLLEKTGPKTVVPLKAGRCDAVESDPVKPVAIEHVEAVYPFVSRQVRAIIELQILTGARPGEIAMMKMEELDRSGDVWALRPAQHKNVHRGHQRTIYIGPQAQAVLTPFLKPHGYLFDPRAAEAERREQAHARRKTPINAGNRPGSNIKRKPKRTAGKVYSTEAYRRAITRACDKADAWVKGGRIVGNDVRVIPRWHPHQLRHTAATELRKRFGIEAAQVILGHKDLSVTEIYAERNEQRAREIAREVG